MKYCDICEREVSQGECEFCGLTKGVAFLTVNDDGRDVVHKTPAVQMPVRDEPLAPYIDMVDKCVEYLLKVRKGEHPEIPLLVLGGEQCEPGDQGGEYPFKENVPGDEYVTYGNRIPGIKHTSDLLTAKTLFLVDIDWPVGDDRFKVIQARNLATKKTYFATLNRQRALHGRMKNMQNLYLMEEETGLFATYESVKYFQINVCDFHKVLHGFWDVNLQLAPLPEVTLLEDLLVFKVEGPFCPDPPPRVIPTIPNKYPLIIQSHRIQMAARALPGEELIYLGDRPALKYTGKAVERGYTVTAEGYMAKHKRNTNIIRPVNEFIKMSPTSKQQVGRVCVDGMINMIIPNVGRNTAPVVRIDDGPIHLVKHQDSTHTTVFMPKEEGPFMFFLQNCRALRPDDTCRFAVSYLTYPNERTKFVGYAHSAIYSEYSGHDYVNTSRLILSPFGTLAKKTYTDDSHLHALGAAVRTKFPHLAINIVKVDRTAVDNSTVHQVYLEIPANDQSIVEFMEDGLFSVTESLWVPVKVYADPRSVVLPPMHDIDTTPVVSVVDFLEL